MIFKRRPKRKVLLSRAQPRGWFKATIPKSQRRKMGNMAYSNAKYYARQLTRLACHNMPESMTLGVLRKQMLDTMTYGTGIVEVTESGQLRNINIEGYL